MMNIEKGSSKLRPRARIIKTIGEELISNDIVAIIELVKNSYDAGSPVVDIRIEGDVFEIPESKQQNKHVVRAGKSGVITISDEGCGMNLETVKKAWMEPATVVKKITSKQGTRRVLGEKGVGRFASARISHRLEMITRVQGDREVFAVFNWEDFSDEQKYLDEVDCAWEVREPQVVEKKGTVLRLIHLNMDWDYDKLVRLRVSLARLINPVAPVKDFTINLELPEVFSSLTGEVLPPASLETPDYRIVGSVDASGYVKMDYSSRKKAVTEEIKQKLSLRPDRTPQCGPFAFEFRVWDREKESLSTLATEVGSTLRDIKRDLDEASGVSIYRDSFRVFPYGEPKNDWLRLDLRRVQSPTMRISNNQVLGFISVGLDENPQLRDQSNREGIIESQAFTDLQEMIKGIMNELERKRYHERPRREKESKGGQLFAAFNLSPVADMISQKLPEDKEAKAVVEETDRKIKEGVEKVQNVLARYRRLSTLGTLLDVVLHDGNGAILKIGNEALLLEKEISKDTLDEDFLSTHLGLIKREKTLLAELFKRLEPFSGRKRGRPKEIILEEAIRDVFVIHQSDLNKYKIRCSLPSSTTKVKIDSAEFEMIIVNLLQNSIYWLQSVDEDKREITVELTLEDNVLTLIFSDSGPGVEAEDIPAIFDPYFSRKPEGIGIGLTHVGELVAEYDGTLELISDGPLDGATFKITFTRRV